MGMIDNIKDNTRLVWLRSKRSKLRQKLSVLDGELKELNAEIQRLER